MILMRITKNVRGVQTTVELDETDVFRAHMLWKNLADTETLHDVWNKKFTEEHGAWKFDDWNITQRFQHALDNNSTIPEIRELCAELVIEDMIGMRNS